MQALFFATFTGGVVMFWMGFLSLFQFSRSSRFRMLIEKLQLPRSDSIAELYAADKKLSYKELSFRTTARLADLPPTMTLQQFNLIRLLFVFIFLFFGFFIMVPDVAVLKYYPADELLSLFFVEAIAAVVAWFLPMLIISTAANGKRGKYMLEIAKFSHRLSLCLSDQADLRDMILRASRTLVLLKPPLQELVTVWGRDHRQAILRFKESINIPEMYPLINALLAVSEAKSEDIVQVLRDQTKSIDDALESEVERQIENAPLFISVLIMIPFGIILLLFIYPWFITVQDSLNQSFTP